jgi:guanosine-3',5'-bis(diphosphate) 3'-pyrophosphohydrolase
LNAKHFSADLERKIEVAWDEGDKKRYVVSIEVVGTDRPGLLLEITRIFSDFGANVTDAAMKSLGQQARGRFKIEIYNKNQLKQILRRLQKIKGIENVSRVKDYIPYTEEGLLKETPESL